VDVCCAGIARIPTGEILESSVHKTHDDSILWFIGECLSSGDKELGWRGHPGASKEEDGARSPRHSENGHHWADGTQHQWTWWTQVTVHWS